MRHCSLGSSLGSVGSLGRSNWIYTMSTVVISHWMTTTAPRSYNTRTPMMALPVWVQECPCMPGLVWYAGDPDECAGKRERAAWDRCVGFEVNATGAARPGKGCVVVPGSNNKAALPNQKPFDRWPCRNHAKKLFKAIEKYACANPLPFDAAGCQALSGDGAAPG